jgi:hypothetical protein
MIGPIVLGAALLYLLISIAVVRGAIHFARSRGRSAKWWGWGAALVMYMIPFWDLLPTVATHEYYCAKDAGFWVYKTPEQWKTENPGVMETLPTPGLAGSPVKHEHFDDGQGQTDTYLLNERFNWAVSQRDISRLLPIIRIEQEVKDAKKNEVLARYIDFATGNSVKDTVGPPGPLKFWLRDQHCSGGRNNQDILGKFRDNFYGSKK